MVGVFTPRVWLQQQQYEQGRLAFLRLLKDFVAAASSVPRDDQREILRCFALGEFEPREHAGAEEAELGAILPAMIARRALAADGARLLGAAARPRSAGVGADGVYSHGYTPSHGMLALAEQHRDAIAAATTAQPSLRT